VALLRDPCLLLQVSSTKCKPLRNLLLPQHRLRLPPLPQPQPQLSLLNRSLVSHSPAPPLLTEEVHELFPSQRPKSYWAILCPR
jgi:hypothetical protein